MSEFGPKYPVENEGRGHDSPMSQQELVERMKNEFHLTDDQIRKFFKKLTGLKLERQWRIQPGGTVDEFVVETVEEEKKQYRVFFTPAREYNFATQLMEDVRVLQVERLHIEDGSRITAQKSVGKNASGHRLSSGSGYVKGKK